MTLPVCLATGVGEGAGAALVKEFAQGGCQAAMLARDRDRLVELESTPLEKI